MLVVVMHPEEYDGPAFGPAVMDLWRWLKALPQEKLGELNELVGPSPSWRHADAGGGLDGLGTGWDYVQADR